ncbi:hypothetical protein CMUS01_10561 [Colletotrichum musicola]|uniref:Uncharacterized protein n=1 Tax=Colletotrichum musicola TaxID=2175873 RepID=A0A8H6K2V2_9PEZI|nr:hypothetical protein CMUS01_10561 [Colletotrichum musicola]
MRTKHSPFIDARQNSRCDGPSAPPDALDRRKHGGEDPANPTIEDKRRGVFKPSLYPSVPGDFYGPAWHDGASKRRRTGTTLYQVSPGKVSAGPLMLSLVLRHEDES